jgi:hypothetical protein
LEKIPQAVQDCGITALPTYQPANFTQDYVQEQTPTNAIGIAPFPAFNPTKILQEHHQDRVDIRTLSLSERQALRRGLGITIRCGSRWNFTMPWRLFQTISTESTNIDRRVPTQLEFHLPANIEQEPFKVLVSWMLESMSARRVAYFQRTASFADNLSLVRAAKLLGMHVYVQRLFDYYWAYIKNNVPTYANMDVIDGLALDENDSFFGCLVGRLAHLRLTKKVEDVEGLERFLESRRRLGRAVKETMKEFKNRRRARNSGYCTSY